MNHRKKVAYIYPYSFQYRGPFHTKLRSILEARHIDYDFIYSREPHFGPSRGDLIDPPEGISVACTYLKLGGVEVRYQHALLKALKYDLVILQQENGLLLNYPLQILAPYFGTKRAFFGHGKNFQSCNSQSLRERFKRLWLTKTDWWFAYTDASHRAVTSAGFPSQRITVFNNSTDTTKIAEDLKQIDTLELERERNRLFGGSKNVAVYVGALYDKKRIGFMIEAARLVREAVPDFHLLVIGGGQDRQSIENAAIKYEWLHYLGPKFGFEKTFYCSLGSMMLMPGLVGLSIVDSFALGIPIITTDVPYHSPEISYLKSGVNGIIVKNSEDISAYANAVLQLISDEKMISRLKEGCRESSSEFSIERMAERFADGVCSALHSV